MRGSRMRTPLPCIVGSMLASLSMAIGQVGAQPVPAVSAPPPATAAQSPAASASQSSPQSAPQVPLPGVDSILDNRTKAVSSRLRCPVCQGESIQDSPAELSAQMKKLVREQLASGQSEGQVFDYFTQKYGQWILLEPKAEGFNLLVYWLPVVFLVLGGGGIFFAVRRWTRPAATTE